jgi:hypothetical protein
MFDGPPGVAMSWQGDQPGAQWSTASRMVLYWIRQNGGRPG